MVECPVDNEPESVHKEAAVAQSELGLLSQHLQEWVGYKNESR